MARFAYLAVDPKGNERRGAIEAADERAATEKLAARAWHVHFERQLSLFLQDINVRLVHRRLSRPLHAYLFLSFDFSFGRHD